MGQLKILDLNPEEGNKQLRVICDHSDTTANPAPLGLLGFGMTTILMSLHLAGFFPVDSMIFGMGIFYGGLAQIIAGIMEWKKNNTFGTTAFTSYGLFWLSFMGLMIFPKIGFCQPPEVSAVVAYLTVWGLFTLAMFVGTLRLSRALQVSFGLAVVLFFGVAIGDATGNHAIKMCAGYEGIFCGLAATYTAFAQVLNEVYGKPLFPLSVVTK